MLFLHTCCTMWGQEAGFVGAGGRLGGGDEGAPCGLMLGACSVVSLVGGRAYGLGAVRTACAGSCVCWTADASTPSAMNPDGGFGATCHPLAAEGTLQAGAAMSCSIR
jgi:hypothetical protein